MPITKVAWTSFVEKSFWGVQRSIGVAVNDQFLEMSYAKAHPRDVMAMPDIVCNFPGLLTSNRLVAMVYLVPTIDAIGVMRRFPHCVIAMMVADK